MFMDLDVEKQCGFGVNVRQRTATTFKRKRKHPVPPVQTPLNKEMTDDAQPSRQRSRLRHMSMCYTRPSYKDKACTIVGSCLLPSTNSSNVSLASLSRSMLLKILSTLFSGVSSSSGSLTIVPVIL